MFGFDPATTRLEKRGAGPETYVAGESHERVETRYPLVLLSKHE
jgi:hypothetical protein